MKRIFLISIIALFFVACTSHIPAPVINRSPQAKPVDASSKSNDWRPNTYTVKKGDTLYSIGLEHGYDYREIAAANNIYAPYTIKIGQTLNFASLNKEAADNTKATTYENENGVIISPVDVVTPTSQEKVKTAKPAPTNAPALTGPKAIREPYSLEAFNRAPAIEKAPTVVENTVPTQTTAPKTTEVKPTENTSSSNTATASVEGITWSWPTQGNVSEKFNGASNKGLDIAGKKGQAITASADGKVIYTGADLRGYGKLVIIKHNKTFLSVYAHNSHINAKEGQIVKAGQKIAEMGDTDASSVKLHFEIRQKGKSVDPALFLPKN